MIYRLSLLSWSPKTLFQTFFYVSCSFVISIEAKDAPNFIKMEHVIWLKCLSGCLLIKLTHMISNNVELLCGWGFWNIFSTNDNAWKSFKQMEHVIWLKCLSGCLLIKLTGMISQNMELLCGCGVWKIFSTRYDAKRIHRWVSLRVGKHMDHVIKVLEWVIYWGITACSRKRAR